LHFHELSSKESELIYEDDKISVRTIPLKHRIYTNGFLFQEKLEKRKLNIDAVQKYKIDSCYYQNIKNGKDITLDDGRIVENNLLTHDPLAAKSYAFCSDTVYNEEVISIIKNVDVLYHEATFLDSEEALASKTMHSTAKQAATIALKAEVKQLILGHYSTRYENIELFNEEAKTIFSATELAEDGKVFVFEKK
jgi:ribonuclease Z